MSYEQHRVRAIRMVVAECEARKKSSAETRRIEASGTIVICGHGDDMMITGEVEELALHSALRHMPALDV